MRRLTVLLVGTLWLFGLLATDVYVTLRKPNVKHHIDAILAGSVGKVISYKSLRGDRLGPYTLEKVQIAHALDPDIIVAEIEEITFWINWTGVLFGQRPVSRVLLKHPLLHMRWNTKNELDVTPLASQPSSEELDLTILPRIEIDGLKLVFVNPPFLLRDDTTFDLESLNITLTSDTLASGSYGFEGLLDDPVLGSWTAQGALVGKTISLEMVRSNLQISDELARRLYADIGGVLEQIQVEGGGSLVARFSNDPKRAHAPWTMRMDFDGATIHYEEWDQEIRDLRGSLIYEQGLFKCEDIIGRLEGGYLEVGGTFDLTGENLITDLSGTLDGLPLTDEFVRRALTLPPPGPNIAEQLERWKVRGMLDVGFELRKEDRPGAPVRPFLKVKLNDCSLIWLGALDEYGVRYGFHYPLEGLQGLIEVDDEGLRFERLEAMNELMVLSAKGEVDYAVTGQETYDINIDVKGIDIDEAILAAFPKATHDVLKPLGIEGNVDAEVRPRREKGQPDPTVPEMTVQLNQIAMCPEVFPLRVEDLIGQVRIQDEYVFIEKAQGRHGSGVIKVNGRIRIDGSIDTLIRIEGTKVPFDAELLAALGAAAPVTLDLFTRVETSGTVDVEGVEIVQTEENPAASVSGIVKLAGARFKDLDSPLEVEFLSGGLKFENDSLELLPDTRLKLRGIPMTATGSYSNENGYRCQLTVEELDLDKNFIELLSIYVPAIAEAGQTPEIEGKATFALKIVGNRKRGSITGTASFHDVNLDPKVWNDTRIEGLACDVVVDFEDKMATIKNLVARIPVPPDVWSNNSRDPAGASRQFEDEAEISFQIERIGLNFSGEDFNGHFERVRLGSIPIHSWVLSLCGLSPEQIKELNPPQMTGSASLRFQSVTVKNRQLVASAGTLGLLDFQLGEDANVFMEEAQIRGISVTPTGDGGMTFDGNLSAKNMRLFSVLVPKLEARLEGGDDGFRLKNVGGWILGETTKDRTSGTINSEETSFGFMWDSGRFDGAVWFDDIDLAEAVRAFGTDPGDVWGSGKFQGVLSGAIRDTATYEGHGSFEVSAHQIFELPLFLKILNVLRLIDPTDLLTSSGPTKVEANFTIADQTVRLKKVALTGKSLDLNGKGVITFDGIVNVSLAAKHKGGFPVISLVMRLITGALLGGVDIKGPIENPKITGTSFGGGESGSEIPKGRVPITKGLKW